MAEAIRPVLREVPAELIGDRVIVRPYHPGDGLNSGRPWMSRGSICFHGCPGDANIRLQKTRRNSYARCMRNGYCVRTCLPGIWERASGRYLGGTGLHRIDWEVPSFEIGYWLRKSAAGNGYMTEAVRLLCNLAFETLGANRVAIHAAAGNLKSAAIPKRLGFVHESTQRNAKRVSNGELVDMLVFAMTPEEYDRTIRVLNL